MRILVTGGAGFIGSHPIDSLMEQGHDFICLENFFTRTAAPTPRGSMSALVPLSVWGQAAEFRE